MLNGGLGFKWIVDSWSSVVRLLLLRFDIGQELLKLMDLVVSQVLLAHLCFGYDFLVVRNKTNHGDPCVDKNPFRQSFGIIEFLHLSTHLVRMHSHADAKNHAVNRDFAYED